MEIKCKRCNVLPPMNQSKFCELCFDLNIADANRNTGTKHDKGKLDYSLLPIHSIQELIKCYMIGVAKYGRDNWRKGFLFSQLFAAMMRHAWKWWGGEERDPIDGQLHLASVAWCALTLIELQESNKGTDDRWSNEPMIPPRESWDIPGHPTITGCIDCSHSRSPTPEESSLFCFGFDGNTIALGHNCPTSGFPDWCPGFTAHE